MQTMFDARCRKSKDWSNALEYASQSYRIDCRIHNSNNGINGKTWTMPLRTCHNYWDNNTVAGLLLPKYTARFCMSNDKNPFAIRFVRSEGECACARVCISEGDFMWKEIRPTVRVRVWPGGWNMVEDVSVSTTFIISMAKWFERITCSQKSLLEKYKIVVYGVVVHCEKYYPSRRLRSKSCIEFPFICSFLIITLFIFDLVRFATKTIIIIGRECVRETGGGENAKKKGRPREQRIRIKRFCARHKRTLFAKVMYKRMMMLDGWKISNAVLVFILLTHTNTHTRAHTWIFRRLRRPKYRWWKKDMVKWKSNQTSEIETDARLQRKLPTAFNAFNYKWLGRWASFASLRSTFQRKIIFRFFFFFESHFRVRVCVPRCLMHTTRVKRFSHFHQNQKLTTEGWSV